MIAGAAEDGQQQRHSTNTTKGRFLMLATQFPYEAINLPTPIALLSCNSSLSWSTHSRAIFLSVFASLRETPARHPHPISLRALGELRGAHGAPARTEYRCAEYEYEYEYELMDRQTPRPGRNHPLPEHDLRVQTRS